ncbi:MAG: type II toxin-antitoxin system VapC family toxin [Terriglobales bacterium]
MKNYVLDAQAVLAFCQGESGARTVEKLLLDSHSGRVALLMSVVNWGEVYYALAHKQGRQAADAWLQDFDRLPVELVGVDREMAFAAAELKAKRRLPYADSFAAALAKLRNATVVTGDPEFERTEPEVAILWLR